MSILDFAFFPALFTSESFAVNNQRTAHKTLCKLLFAFCSNKNEIKSISYNLRLGDFEVQITKNPKWACARWRPEVPGDPCCRLQKAPPLNSTSRNPVYRVAHFFNLGFSSFSFPCTIIHCFNDGWPHFAVMSHESRPSFLAIDHLRSIDLQTTLLGFRPTRTWICLSELCFATGHRWLRFLRRVEEYLLNYYYSGSLGILKWGCQNQQGHQYQYVLPLSKRLDFPSVRICFEKNSKQILGNLWSAGKM